MYIHQNKNNPKDSFIILKSYDFNNIKRLNLSKKTLSLYVSFYDTGYRD